MLSDSVRTHVRTQKRRCSLVGVWAVCLDENRDPLDRGRDRGSDGAAAGVKARWRYTVSFRVGVALVAVFVWGVVSDA